MEVRRSLSEHLQRWSRRRPLLLYLGTITLMTAIFAGSLLAEASVGALPGWEIALIAVLSVLSVVSLPLPW